MRTKRSIKDSLKEYLNWCVGRLLLGGSRDDTVRDMVDAISDEIASGGGGVSQDQLDQTVKDITKSYGIADQTVLTSAEQYTDQKIADVVDGSPEALDTLYELAKALGDDSNFATTVMDQIGQKLPTTTFENFIDNKAWTKDNLTKLSQLINNINSIKAGTRVESMDVNLASISSYLEYDLFDNNTTGTKPPGLTTGFLLTFSWDNGGWGAQIATSDGNVDGAIFLRTIKASESDKIWGPWVSLYNTANFNPDDKFGFVNAVSDLNNAPMNAAFSTNRDAANAPVADAYFQGFTFAMDSNPDFKRQWAFKDGKIWFRNLHNGSWSAWTDVIPLDNYLPLSGNKMITGDFQFKDGVSVRDAAGRSVVGLLDVAGDGVCVVVGNSAKKTRIVTPNDTPVYRNDSKGTYRIYDSGNFNPDSKLNYNGFNGDLNTIDTSGLYHLGPGCTNTPNSGSSTGGHILHTKWDTAAGHQLYFEYYGSMFYRYKHGGEWSVWNRVWTGFEFNPDNYLPKKGDSTLTGTLTVTSSLTAGIIKSQTGEFPQIQFEQTTAGVTSILFAQRNRELCYRYDSADTSKDATIYNSLNLVGATTSKAGLMSAADKTKLDGLSDQINVVGQASSTYIFPGDPSELDSSSSSTHITLILGTASDFLDAFNNGKVFVSKTVTFNEVQVPSDITYSLLKSIDPDNPTIFQIIMSTVVWGHYIEITIDFENNEYQAISNTINGIIGVNNTGTTN